MSRREIQVIHEDGTREPKEFNAWRLFPEDEKTLVLQLGHRVDQTITVVCNAKFSARMLRGIIAGFYKAGLEVEKQFNTDLGLHGKSERRLPAAADKSETNEKQPE